MQAAKASKRAAVLLPGGGELPLPVAPADVPQPLVNFMLRTVLRHSSGQGDGQDPYDVSHARFLAAAFIALMHQDQPSAPARSRRQRPAADPPGMAALF